MEYEWDEVKNRANIARGRPSFAVMADFEWDTASVNRSDRYGEVRWAATGYVGDRLHRAVCTERGFRTRIISLRKASLKEMRDYAEA